MSGSCTVVGYSQGTFGAVSRGIVRKMFVLCFKSGKAGLWVSFGHWGVCVGLHVKQSMAKSRRLEDFYSGPIYRALTHQEPL